MSTKQRIMHRLAEMAAEEQTSGFGAMIAGAYAMGFSGLIADALPDDDAQADALLEDFAGLVLELRSDAQQSARPFLPADEFAAIRDRVLSDPRATDDEDGHLENDAARAGLASE